MKVILACAYRLEEQADGTTTVAHNIVEGLKKNHDILKRKNIEVIILSHHGEKHSLTRHKSEYENIQYYTYGKFPLQPVIGDLQAIYNIIHIDGEIDLIHSHFTQFGIAGDLLNLPVYHTVHGLTWHEKKYSVGIRSYLGKVITEKKLKRVIENSDKVLTISKYVEDELAIKYNTPSEKFDMVENPVSDDFFSIPSNTSSEQIFCPAIVQPRKNQKYLINAVSNLPKKTTDFNVVFTGPIRDKNYFNELYNIIEENGLERHVEFLGNVSERKLLKIYESSSIVCLPSLQETAPMVVSEAMASGTPVIATDVGGVSNMVIDGETGFIVPTGRHEILQKRINKLLHNPKTRETFGRKSKQVAKRWSSETIGKKLINQYCKFRD